MTDKELFELCQQYGREARLARNKFVALLPEVYRRGLYRKKGFGSIFEFAAKLGGVSKNVVEDILNLDKKLEDKPALLNLVSKVGVNKVRVVANIAKKTDQNEWAEKVQKMTKSALETHVKDIRSSDPGIGKPITPEMPLYDNFETFALKLNPKTIQRLKHLKANMKPGTTWNDVINFLLDNKKLKKQRARNLKAEAKIMCEHPGCNKPAVEIHHKKPWAINKSHDELEALCKAHHELAHQSDSMIDRKFRTYKMQVSMF